MEQRCAPDTSFRGPNRVLTVELTGKQQALKQSMFACFRTQADVLKRFDVRPGALSAGAGLRFHPAATRGYAPLRTIRLGHDGRQVSCPGRRGVADLLTILSVAYPLAPVRPHTAGGAEQVLAQLDRVLVAGRHRSIVIACETSEVAGELVAIPLLTGTLDDAAKTRPSSRFVRQFEMYWQRRG